MKSLEEKVFLSEKKKSSFVIGSLAAGVLFSAGCGPTPEEECCDCLVENGCTMFPKALARISCREEDFLMFILIA